MKGFKDSTKMQSGHTFSHPSTWFPQGHATGGTINRLARGGKPRDGVPRGINGVDEHDDAPDGGNALQHRGVPSTEELKEAGGHSPLKSGFSEGGKAEKHFHVHHHYHGGKAAKGKGLKKMEMQAESEAPDHSEHYAGGGRKKSGIKIKKSHEGSLHKDMGVAEGKTIPVSKIRKKLAHDKATHNVKGEEKDVFAINAKTKFNHATGGTINRLNAGGALYARGGHKGHSRHPRKHSGPPPGALQALAALGGAGAPPAGPPAGPPPGAALPPAGPPGGLARGGKPTPEGFGRMRRSR